MLPAVHSFAHGFTDVKIEDQSSLPATHRLSGSIMTNNQCQWPFEVYQSVVVWGKASDSLDE
jgi:hypothetical protein